MPRLVPCFAVLFALALAEGASASETGGATPPTERSDVIAGGGAAHTPAKARKPARRGPAKRIPVARKPVGTSHRFPVGGAFDFGGSGGRFGAGRKGHSHQGQDLAAAEGTPVVAPSAGVVQTVQYQASGAGHYVVLDGDGEDRDYVFMHLQTGSIPVREGTRVRAGQLIGRVGNTGRSFGAHLHFEVWVGGGWYSGGRPVDPLPLLQSWLG